jgi:hypothetical protein
VISTTWAGGYHIGQYTASTVSSLKKVMVGNTALESRPVKKLIKGVHFYRIQKLLPDKENMVLEHGQTMS